MLKRIFSFFNINRCFKDYIDLNFMSRKPVNYEAVRKEYTKINTFLEFWSDKLQMFLLSSKSVLYDLLLQCAIL